MRYFIKLAYLPFTASFNALPALNTGALLAGTDTNSFVLGFTLLRAARLRTSNLPRPAIATSSPLFKAVVTAARAVSNTSVTSFCVRPVY